MHAIPVTAGSRREVVAALDRARAELAAGHVVCIFAEGAISRTGNLLPFQRGFERIVKGLDVPIVPVYLDRVWGSVFSFKRGKFFWKLPERLPYPVTVAWGTPLPSTATATEVRQAISELGSTAMSIRREPGTRLHVEFMRSARRRWSHLAMADTHGPEADVRPSAHRRVRVRPRARTADAGRGRGRHAAAGVGRRRAGEHRSLHRRQAAGQPQLHDRAGSARPRHSAGRHQDDPHVAEVSREGEPARDAGDGRSSKISARRSRARTSSSRSSRRGSRRCRS